MTDEEKVRKYNPYSQTAILNATIKDLEKENAELKEQNKTILEDNDTLNKWIDELKAQIENYKLSENESKEIVAELKEQNEKMKNDQKTAFIKGMRHFAKAMKKYDQTEGAWTDYFEHTIDTVLNRELAENDKTL